MERQATIDLLQQHRATLKDFGVKSLAVFDSVARHEAHDSSDLNELADPVFLTRES